MEKINYFKDLSKSEIRKLQTYCEKWTNIPEDLSDEILGRILSVIGQCKLLISEKFKQFNGLIETCENNDGDFKITIDDLQGFWDLVNIQIEDIINKFNALETLKSNQWIPTEEIKLQNSLARRKKIETPKKTHENAAKERWTVIKNQMRSRLKSNENKENILI